MCIRDSYKSIDRKTTSAAPFSDVKGLSSELRAAINWAYANGIVNGVDKTCLLYTSRCV